MKSLVGSWTFWFGFLQIALGVVGLVSHLADANTSMTLIGTGITSIVLRLKTTKPIVSVLPVN